MNEQFTTYKIQIKAISSVVTPFQADTIFGTICWGIALLEGSDKLAGFLRLYKDKETIPLIVSDGLLDGYLPMPLIEPLTLEESEGLVNSLIPQGEPLKKIDYIHRLKGFKKVRYLPVGYFNTNKEAFSQSKLSKDYLEERLLIPSLIEDTYTIRTSIDRYTGMAMEGRLFSTQERFYNSKINIYVKLRDGSGYNLDWLKKIFGYIEATGYGADKSMGKGQIKIESIQQGNNLPQSYNPNAFISLSSFVPEQDDPSEGWYVPLLKYGRLGEHFANSPIDKIIPETNERIGHNPFKRPLLMFSAGSTFKLKEGEVLMPYYGRVVENIHWDRDIVHYGLAFPLGIRLNF